MSANRHYSDSEKFIIKTFKACNDPICYYCGKNLKRLPKSQRTIDHKTPLDQGGETTYTNLAWACQKCNNEKAWRNEVEYKEFLLEKHQIESQKVIDILKPIAKITDNEIHELPNDIPEVESVQNKAINEIEKKSLNEIKTYEINENINIKKIKKTLKHERNKEKRKKQIQINVKKNEQKINKKINKIIHDSNYYKVKKFNKKKSINKIDKLFKQIEK